MYSILFVISFLFLLSDSQNNVPSLDAFSTTAELSQETSDSITSTALNTPTLERLLSSSVPSTQEMTYSPTSPWPIPLKDESIWPWSTEFPEFDDLRCIPTENDLDIIFVVDSSTNSYAVELNLISDIIENVLPINSRVGLINFSGCTRKFTFKQCKQRGLLKKIISLQKDMEVVINAVNSLQSGIH